MSDLVGEGNGHRQPETTVQVVPWSYAVERVGQGSDGRTWCIFKLLIPSINLNLQLMLTDEEARQTGAKFLEAGSGITLATEVPPGTVPPA